MLATTITTQGGEKTSLIAELGSGGMAEVYLALVEGKAGFSKLQVVKRLRNSLAQDSDFVRMFLDEARLAARLNHPNVIQTHEIGESADGYFLVMEYLEGHPLSRLRAQHLRKMGKPLPVEMGLRVLVDVLRGLEHAHNLADFDGTPLSIVHRDVSPQNIFVTYDGIVKVLDFGVAKAAMNSVETRTGVMKGKLAYMAPEQVQGDSVDRRADLFSVGVMLYESVSGEKMWKNVPDVAIMSNLLAGKLPPLPPNTPGFLTSMLGRALAFRPEDRYQTAGVFAIDLETALREFPVVPQEEIGGLMCGLFQAERERGKKVIEMQLKNLRGPSRSSVLPRFSLPTESRALVSEAPAENSFTRSRDAALLRGSVPEAPLVPHFSSLPSEPELPDALDAPSSQVPTRLESGSALRTPAPVSPPSASRGLSLRVLIGIPVMAICAWYFVTTWPRRSDLASPATIGSTTAAAAIASGTAPTAPVGTFVFSITPMQARISLDGKPLPGNPYETTFPLDGSEHTLSAEAMGFQSRTETLHFDRGGKIALSLAPVANTTNKSVGSRPQVAGQHLPTQDSDIKITR